MQLRRMCLKNAPFWLQLRQLCLGRICVALTLAVFVFVLNDNIFTFSPVSVSHIAPDWEKNSTRLCPRGWRLSAL